MIINCYYQSRESFYRNWTVPNIFKGVLKLLKKIYPNYTFNFINTIGKDCNKFKYNVMVLENEKNKKYISLWYADEMSTVDEKNLVQIIGSIGGHDATLKFKKCPIDYTPASFSTCGVVSEQSIENYYSPPVNKRYNNLWFKGFVYAFRNFLLQDSRFDIIPVHNNAGSHNYEDFIKEVSNHRIALSLNGQGEVCHRDIEYFGVGTVNIRPILTTQFYNKLIPGKHYIGIKHDDIKDKDINYYHSKLKERIFNTYIEVKDDISLLNTISNNARKWYLENGTIEKNIQILLKVIDLKKLL